MSSGREFLGVVWLSSGKIVFPEWPPITGTFILSGLVPLASPTKVFALTTSREVTPKSLAGL